MNPCTVVQLNVNSELLLLAIVNNVLAQAARVTAWTAPTLIVARAVSTASTLPRAASDVSWGVRSGTLL